MADNDPVLVLGATGHIGQAVVRELLSQGRRVTAASRQTAPANLAGLDVSIATGDHEKPGQLDEWVCGHELVIDAAAPYPLGVSALNGPGQPSVFDSARRRTRALLDAVARHGSRLAFVSSFTTLPRPEQGPFAVEAEMRRRIYPYFTVKAEMEEMVRAAAEAGLPAVIVNPTACLGPWEARCSDSSLVYQALTRRLPVVSRDLVNVVDVRDVAVGVLRAVEARRYAKPIALCGHNIGLADLVRRLCELGGTPAPPLSADARTTALFAFWIDSAYAFMGRPAPMAVRAAPLIADAWPMEVGGEQQALGVHPRPLDETLRASVLWQQQGRVF